MNGLSLLGVLLSFALARYLWRLPKMGDVGPIRRRIDLEPLPDSVPVPEQTPVPAPVPEPAR